MTARSRRRLVGSEIGITPGRTHPGRTGASRLTIRQIHIGFVVRITGEIDHVRGAAG